MAVPVSAIRPYHTEIEITTQRFHKLSVGNHRNSTPIPRAGAPTPPITIPARRASRRSFELMKSPTPRSRSFTLPSSSPSGSSPEKTKALFDDVIFKKAIEAYTKGDTSIDPVLKILQKHPFDVSALMKDEGDEIIKSLGQRQVECISKLLEADARTFPKSAPLRENTLCTAFYREFCNYHFAKSLKECAKNPKKELSQVVEKITKKLKKQDLSALRVIHNVMKRHIPMGEITNFKAFIVVTFINRVVSPIFTIKSGDSSKPSEAEAYKIIAKQLQRGSSMYLAGKNKSDDGIMILGESENSAFDALADLLYSGK